MTTSMGRPLSISAGLLNALEINGKKSRISKIVVNGAGAAAVSCTKLYIKLGAETRKHIDVRQQRCAKTKAQVIPQRYQTAVCT